MDKLDYTKFSDMTVKIHSHAKEPSHQLLRGRAILNPDESDFIFVEYDYRAASTAADSANARRERRRDILMRFTVYGLGFRV